jgi:hypothetical protein
LLAGDHRNRVRLSEPLERGTVRILQTQCRNEIGPAAIGKIDLFGGVPEIVQIANGMRVKPGGAIRMI